MKRWFKNVDEYKCLTKTTLIEKYFQSIIHKSVKNNSCNIHNILYEHSMKNYRKVTSVRQGILIVIFQRRGIWPVKYLFVLGNILKAIEHFPNVSHKVYHCFNSLGEMLSNEWHFDFKTNLNPRIHPFTYNEICERLDNKVNGLKPHYCRHNRITNGYNYDNRV